MRIAVERSRFVLSGIGIVLAFSFLAGCGGVSSSSSPAAPAVTAITTQPVASGFTKPLDLEQPGDNSGRLFVVEQGGTIRIIQNGAALPQPFLNIAGKVITGGEKGLLGLTFHPSLQAKRKVYLNYVRRPGGEEKARVGAGTGFP